MEKKKKGTAAAKQTAALSVNVPNEPLTAVQQMKETCHNHMHRYVLAQTHHGWCIDGFVEHMDDEVVCLAVPNNSQGWDSRAFIPQSPPGPGLYPYPFYPRRRFYRQIFPYGALRGVSLLPYY
ncbi:hypothetical protein [Paenibacillus radicis (ex Gao et al. 2016)]|uniref:Uncharacterized protein n=1 Tax=Paenibacillus radicis (ex Gao et al. 2016) TaxID=1737354 RepID=A0A917LTN4_9BACL|nr:hypothetical protein [Paenibacillus radicis (ex Gao et al. 2016)]GGG56216.1 hypothetical protein GCM10010918_06460 [Paenibacillus radicis (ex Gao et al. 2016)]